MAQKPLGKPAKAQLMKWIKAGPANCTVVSQNHEGKDGNYTIDFPFHGKQVTMAIDFSGGFPAKVPDMRFTTKMWHCGVDEKTGAICKAAITPWTAATGPQKLCDHVTEMLANPGSTVESGINVAACAQFKD